MLKKVDEATELATQITKYYNALTITNSQFFDLYHDTMLYQKNGAWEEVDELEAFIKQQMIKPSVQNIDGVIKKYIKNLKDTLKYCKAVIKAQTQVNKIPDAIFG